MKSANHSNMAQTFSALGHPKRICILEILLDKLPDKITFGQIQQATGFAPSTLTHHLREMESGNVIIRKPEGKSTSFALNLNHLQKILGSFMSKCCNNELGNLDDQ